MKKSVVILEDDKDINDSLRMLFEDNGFEVDSYLNAEDFYNKSSNFSSNTSYLIDWMLPGTHGIDVIKRIRMTNRFSPVFLMSAAMEHKVGLEALGTGADHFLKKPFDADEILLRFENAYKKLDSIENQFINVGIKILPEANTVIKDGKTLPLTFREFTIFQTLYNSQGVTSRADLTQEFSKGTDKKLTERNIDVHIFSLRKKLAQLDMAIETVWGEGYKLQM